MELIINDNTKFYMQRIAHQGDISFNLLDAGFLIYGWRDMMKNAYEHDVNVTFPMKESELEKIYEMKYGKDDKARNRWNVWRFFNYNIDDYILVPSYKSFSVYQVIETATNIFDCKYIDEILKTTSVNNENICFDKSKGIYIENRCVFDIGMICKVQPVCVDVDKKYASAYLESKLKYQGANLELTEIKNEIIESIENCENNRTVSFYNKLIDEITDEKKDYYKYLKPDNLEILMKNYLYKIGADFVHVNAKNESGKEDYADCDVEGIFESLKVRIIIQCKHHNGKECDEKWAIEQITKYYEQTNENYSEYTMILWIVSTVKSFSDETISQAENNNMKVRLIDQKELIGMLINAGFTPEMEFEK